MKILLLQISDIHFKKEGNLVVERVAAIKNAVQGIDSAFDACFVTMTGDVAYGGQAEEYEVAHGFFDALKAALSSLRDGLRVEEVFIPGNHDCALKPENEIRSLVLSNILEKPQLPFRPSDAYIELCLQPQEEFWKFYERRLGTAAPSLGSERLFQTHDFDLGGKTLRFECYNTAWMSQLHEQPGQLLVPTNLADEVPPHKPDAVVSLLHHPFNWIEPVNSKALRREIEKRSDIVLTGHEHVGDQFTKKGASGTINEYLEGAVLQETGADNSGFYAMLLDLETRQRRVQLYSWQGDHYAPDGAAEWVSFERTRALSAARFENTDAFSAILRDVGAPFKHPDPMKAELYLDDIFVYPDFDQRTYSHNSNVKVSKVSGDETIGYILKQSRILFFGNDRCGKSAFARKIYRDLQEHDKIPLLLDGTKLKSPEEGAMKTLIDRAVGEQYGAEMVEKFRQLDPQRKVLLVDNFHASSLNLKAQNLAVERFNLQFGKVILFGAETVRYQELDHSNGEYSVLLSFQQCELHPFGKRARGQLIEKWCSLGSDFLDNEREVANKIREAENLVSILMRKSLLPAYPIFILIILQQFETHSNLDTASGSYGYYYDVLITTALYNHSKKIPIDMLYPFLSRVAYRMFEGRKASLSREEWEDVARLYQQEHKVTFSSQEMMRIVQEARMLHCDSEGYYSFQYKYIGYFFVARYFKDNVYKQAQQQKLRQQLQGLVNRIYIEDDANILMFFLYMTKDERTIEELVAKTRTLFAGVAPCDFDTHVAFINRKGNSMTFELESGNTQEHRDAYRKSQDEADHSNIQGTETELDDDLDTMDEEDEGAAEDPGSRELAVAMRTLEVMGQVLCNFPGTLDGQTKLEIAQECYLVGLRFVRAFLQMIEVNEQGFRDALARSLQGPQEEDFDDQGEYVAKRLSKLEAEERANALFYGFLMLSVWGLVKRISQCIGSRHLSETYKEVADARVPTSIELMTTSIKLDHFQDFPTEEVLALHKKLKGNNFTDTILRCIVREYFHLHPSDPQTRQKVCNKLKIRHEAKALLPGTPATKKPF